MKLLIRSFLGISIAYTCQAQNLKSVRQFVFENSIIYDMVSDTCGFLWLSTSQALYKFNGKNYFDIKHDGEFSYFSKLVCTKNNELYALNILGEIYRYDPYLQKLRLFYHKDTTYPVEGITTDSKGHLWSSSSQGFTKHHVESGSDTLFETKNALVQKLSSGLSINNDFLVDEYDHLWMTTKQNEIICYDYKSNQILFYKPFPQSAGACTESIYDPNKSLTPSLSLTNNRKILVTYPCEIHEIDIYTFQTLRNLPVEVFKKNSSLPKENLKC